MRTFHYTVPMEHMAKPGEWQLHLSYHGLAPTRIKCPQCNGKGHYEGLMRSWDDDDKCTNCYGSGDVRNPEYIEPQAPQWLVDQLSKVMRDAWNKSQNEEFKLV